MCGNHIIFSNSDSSLNFLFTPCFWYELKAYFKISEGGDKTPGFCPPPWHEIDHFRQLLPGTTMEMIHNWLSIATKNLSLQFLVRKFLKVTFNFLRLGNYTFGTVFFQHQEV